MSINVNFSLTQLGLKEELEDDRYVHIYTVCTHVLINPTYPILGMYIF